MAEPNPRDRRRARTQQALRAAARRLFRDQGYANTTVEQIADAADVSPRTFFRYFAAKEDLLLPDLDELFDHIEQGVTARPKTEHLLDTALYATVAVLGAQSRPGGLTTIAPELDPADTAIVNRMAKVFLAWEARLSRLLTERLFAETPDLDPAEAELRGTVTAHLAVATCRGAIRTLRARAPGVPADPAELSKLLDAAVAIARAGSGE